MSEGVGGMSGKSRLSGSGPVKNPIGALAVAGLAIFPQLAYLTFVIISLLSFGLLNLSPSGFFPFAFEPNLLRIFTLPLLVVAAVTAFLPVKGPQDYYGGIALAALALFAFWASSDLPGMRGFQFGPGTAPRLFAGLMLALGVAIALLALFIEGPGLQRYHWRGPVFVSIAILQFAVTIRPLGLVISAFACFMIAALGSNEQRWTQTLIVGIAITAFCSVLFPYALGLPFQLWPRFLLR
jgi:hypothetical protein